MEIQNEVYVNSNIPLHKEDNIIKKIAFLKIQRNFLRKKYNTSLYITSSKY